MADDVYVDPELPEGEPPAVDLSSPAVPEVVAVLRRMLADAEAGEVIAVAITAATSDNGFITGYAGDYQVTLLGGLAHLTHRINRDLEGMADADR